ncbi:hypothetical protein C8F04DRAFT_1070136 [Mycena alexandri]|uniref:Uncharacterized protein n=1 Tax=Mycena alexandri TaxID=1745969 RepID=A0AAD6XGE0_9AGAR|nr:hypothetical protein C8F04DRAFT_1070136 [Mycena alexandri]
MKSTTFAALLVLATGAIARNCTPDLDYCGRTLLEIGNYQPQIDQALHDAGVGEANGGADDLFHCSGGPNGERLGSPLGVGQYVGLLVRC